jgi:hypothetical protein
VSGELVVVLDEGKIGVDRLGWGFLRPFGEDARGVVLLCPLDGYVYAFVGVDETRRANGFRFLVASAKHVVANGASP